MKQIVNQFITTIIANGFKNEGLDSFGDINFVKGEQIFRVETKHAEERICIVNGKEEWRTSYEYAMDIINEYGIDKLFAK